MFWVRRVPVDVLFRRRKTTLCNRILCLTDRDSSKFEQAGYVHSAGRFRRIVLRDSNPERRFDKLTGFVFRYEEKSTFGSRMGGHRCLYLFGSHPRPAHSCSRKTKPGNDDSFQHPPLRPSELASYPIEVQLGMMSRRRSSRRKSFADSRTKSQSSRWQALL